MKVNRLLMLLYSLLVIAFNINAKEYFFYKNFTLGGYVKDADTGEELIGATIFIKEEKIGTATNVYGYYSISLEPGTYTIEYSYLGYESKVKTIKLDKDLVENVDLKLTTAQVDEVVVTSEKKNNNITSAEMSTVKLPMMKIQKIPALAGEVDVIKAIQLLPGVHATSEGSSGFSVRGGSMDQNLILLDEATVYNASHMLGFFSVFNNDAIKDVKLYKGDIPADYGGRLSSVLDVRMREGNNKGFDFTGGIGTISSRLTVEGPLVKEKASFLVSGRRTYADIFLPLAKNEELHDNQLYFYDFNTKLNYRLNQRNRIFLSGYLGRDVFKNDFANMGFGNKTITTRWNHLFTPKLFSNLTLIYSNYDYELGTSDDDENSFLWNSSLEDVSAKLNFNYFLNAKNTLDFGISSTYHTFRPGLITGSGIVDQFELPANLALEHGVYLSNQQRLLKGLTLKYGLLFSAFQNIGEAKIYKYDDQYNVIDTAKYQKGDIFNTEWGLEPRIGINYEINKVSAIKASYSRTKQYVQLASNSVAGTPLDIWFPTSPNVTPQRGDQYAVGYVKNFFNHALKASLEAYYKNIHGVVDFKDFARLLLNPYLEGEIRRGNANSYGLEVLLQVPEGKLNGWLSYTYSKTIRNVPGINDGKSYVAPYDKPHDIAVVMNYQLSNKLNLSTNWIYNSAQPLTLPVGKYKINGKTIPIYSRRNAYRVRDYHRLDFSVKYGKDKFNLVFSVYNVYKRKNLWSLNFVDDPMNPGKTYAEMTYLFSIVPAITINFKF